MFHDVSLWSAALRQAAEFLFASRFDCLARCRPSPPGGLQANKSLPHAAWSERKANDSNDSNDYQSEDLSGFNVDPFELHLDPPR